MNEFSAWLAGVILGAALGWCSFGLSVQTDCTKINGFVMAGKFYSCEVKK